MADQQVTETIQHLEHPELLARRQYTQNLKNEYQNLFVLPETPFLLFVHTIMRDRTTPRSEFVFHSDLMFRSLIEYSLELVDYEPLAVETSTGNTFNGLVFKNKQQITGVSILRSGAVLERPLMDSVSGVAIGKILVQRDDSTADKKAKLFYSKLPENIQDTTVLLLDPMLATGGSANLCLDVLIEAGCKPENIVFVCAIASPFGIQKVFERHPNIKLVATMVDSHLNEDCYLIPGCGDYGDRFYSTD